MQSNDLFSKIDKKSPDILSKKSGHFSTFQVDLEVTYSIPN